MAPNRRPGPANGPSPSGDGFELGLVVALGAVLVVVGVVYSGAWLAAWLGGGHVGGGITELLGVVGRLAKGPGDPTAAWGDLAAGLPGAGKYWACTVGVLVVAVGVVSGAVVLWRRSSRPKQQRVGVDTDARMATRRDVKPVVIGSAVPPTGRMLLGRLAPRGPMLATEDSDRHRMKGRRAAERQGDRASVALIGPTRSGKTVLASAGMVGWDGPVIALSVKRDLYDATAAARAKRGDIAVFDPSGVTGLPTARWTPLRSLHTTSDASRAGRALAQAIPTNGVSGGDFWKSHGETLTTAYMELAALSIRLPAADGTARPPLTMGRLAMWAYRSAGINDPTAHELIELGLADDQPLETRLLASTACTRLTGFEETDPKIRASIYATARLAFEAWNEPAIAHSASLDPRASYFTDEIWDRQPVYIDLDWLMGGPAGRPRTLYMSAPSYEFDRLAPVFGGLLGDMREQIHAWDVAGKKLKQPLMILIDEAGQLELRWFPDEVSTIAGLGAMFVTGWQSKAQITARYGPLADAVLSGHRSKVIFNGTDDPSTLDYVRQIAGTVHVPQRGTSTDGRGRRTVSDNPQREDLLPAHVIRQMKRNEAVLLHGTLPPIHLRLVQWWKNKELRRLVPHGPNGKPLPPPTHGTCPVGGPRTSSVSSVIDEGVIAEQRASMQRVKTGGNGQSRVVPIVPTLSLQGVLEFPPVGDIDYAETVEANPVASYCAVCGVWLEPGEGQKSIVSGREVVQCAHEPHELWRSAQGGRP